jgi:hypothetical protein
VPTTQPKRDTVDTPPEGCTPMHCAMEALRRVAKFEGQVGTPAFTSIIRDGVCLACGGEASNERGGVCSPVSDR